MGVRNNRVLLDGHVAGLGQDSSRYLRGTLREQGSDARWRGGNVVVRCVDGVDTV